MACTSISCYFLYRKPNFPTPPSPNPSCCLNLFPRFSPLSSHSQPALQVSLLPQSCAVATDFVDPRRPREKRRQLEVCRAAAEYVFPNPIPAFADSEINKFRNHLLEKLSKKDIFKDSVQQIVEVCTEILGNFLHTEYGGPGTLLVLPFIDMADAINERGLPGAPQAARAAVVWAQNHLDNDWKEWTGTN
ncbi:hypothetical protein ZOSMA_219G00110 [Zostera marina]|uniref:Protein PLASTID REDOX INSENSITIVE 2, chloroplastic n=1 Tax=Zostera marina TaxID=29655 RepID=A0A0K9PM27_ZOSMR|nr:hypothetical protein ZOSMA_219G00110 [Zostera marina]